ncbi:hypothetical protein EV368DRAFT_90513 [Lentinula lateritia]|nr:hypothetical protein EV368DRAFT_90513 [Lentinula lateritia]
MTITRQWFSSIKDSLKQLKLWARWRIDGKGNVEAPYVQLCAASPLPPPLLEDANRCPPLPGTSFPGSHSIGSSHV